MPVALGNLTQNSIQTLLNDSIIVQYPFAIENKQFANIYLFQSLKIKRVIATLVDVGTTTSSFTVSIPGDTITVTISAGQSNSNIWTGEKIVSAGSNIFFISNGISTGKFLTIIVEGEYF